MKRTLRENPLYVASRQTGPIPLAKLLACTIAGSPFYFYVLALLKTCTFKLKDGAVDQVDLSRPTILFSWHQNIYLTTFLVTQIPKYKRTFALSHDGFRNLSITLQAGFLGQRNFIFTLKNKANRVDQILQAFEHERSIFVMADGGGPFFRVKPGLLRLAAAAGAQLVPVAFQMEKGLIAGRHRDKYPIPFCRIQYLPGEPIDLPEDFEESVFMDQCEKELDQLEERMRSSEKRRSKTS